MQCIYIPLRRALTRVHRAPPPSVCVYIHISIRKHMLMYEYYCILHIII